MKLFLLLLICQILVCKAQDIFDKKSSLEYCNFLIREDKYENVGLEYERIKFLHWQTDTLLYNLSLLHWHHKNNFQKLQFENQLLIDYPNSMFSKWLNFNKNKIKPLEDIQKLDTLTQYMYLKSLIFNSNWEVAENLIIGNTVLTSLQKSKAIKVIQNGLKIKQKSPVLGAVLSVFVPGSGKIYANEFKDGAFSLLFVASSAFGLWRIVENNGWNSPWAYLFGGVSAGFYIGNIYGSFHSVKKYNSLQNKNLNHEKYLYLLDE